MTRTRVLIAIFIITGGALLVLFLRFWVNPQSAKPELTIGNTTIEVLLAETPEAQQQGLSGKAALKPNEGMLFLFEDPQIQGFWMKDMRFSIDIIWIDKNWQIAGISPNLSPDSYPEVFYSPQEVQYVLEVPAGFSTRENLSVGQAIQFER
jgi:uncharacterized membrane protein (UPF0127 family)